MTDVHTVTLPALNGRDPLGFLTAVGITVVTDSALSFDTADGTAILHSHYRTTDDIANALHHTVNALTDTALIPHVDSPLPKQRVGNSGADPMRLPRHQFGDLIDQYRHDPQALAWISNLVTDLAVDNEGRAIISAYMAPSGKQTMGTFFSKSLQQIRRDPEHLHHAVVGWRRIKNFSGEYFDHSALSTAADHPSGDSTESGVPGATWLATMALPLLRLTAINNRAAATAWHRVHGIRGSHMVWPLWRQALVPHAIQALLEHPDLVPVAHQGQLAITTRPAKLDELGIFHIAAAYRKPIEGRKFAGVLTPQPIELISPTTAPTGPTII